MAEKALVLDLQARNEKLVAALREVANEGRGTDAALAAMADRIADALEDINKRGGDSLSRLDNNLAVSKHRLTELQLAADDVRRDVIATFGSLENAPEKFRASVANAQATVQLLTDKMAEQKKRAEELGAAYDATAEAAEELAEVERQAAEEAKRVADQLADIPDKIDDLRSSNRLFKEQKEGFEDILRALRDQERGYVRMKEAGEPALRVVRDAIKRVETDLESLTRESSTAAGQLRDSFIRVGRAFDDLDASVESWSPKAVANLARARVAAAELETQIDAIRKGGGAVSDDQLAKLQRFQAQIAAASPKVRELADDIADLKTESAEAGETWSGLGDAVTKAAGPMGALVGKIGLVTAAFREGWQIGMEGNRLFGTDMSLWEGAVEKLGKKIGIVIRATSDDIVSFGGLVKAALTPGQGYTERLARAWDDLKDTIGEHIEKVGDLEAQLRKEEAALKAVEAAQKKAREEEEKAKEAAKKLADEKKRLEDQINGVVRSLREETIELMKQQAIASQAGMAARRTGSDMEYLGRGVADLTKRVEDQKKALAELTQKYGESDPFTTNAAETLRLLEQQLASAQVQYEKTKAEVEAYTATQKAAESQIQSQTERVRGLTEQHAEHEKQIAGLNAGLTLEAQAQREAAKAANEAADSEARRVAQIEKNLGIVGPATAATQGHTTATQTDTEAKVAGAAATDAATQSTDANRLTTEKATIATADNAKATKEAAGAASQQATALQGAADQERAAAEAKRANVEATKQLTDATGDVTDAEELWSESADRSRTTTEHNIAAAQKLQDARRGAQGSAEDWAAQEERTTQALDRANEAIRNKENVTRASSGAVSAHVTEDGRLVISNDQVAASAQKSASAVEETAKAIPQAADAAREGAQPIREFKAAADEAAGSVKKVAERASELATALNAEGQVGRAISQIEALTTTLRGMDTVIGSILAKIREFPAATKAAAEGLEEMAGAGMEDDDAA